MGRHPTIFDRVRASSLQFLRLEGVGELIGFSRFQPPNFLTRGPYQSTAARSSHNCVDRRGVGGAKGSARSLFGRPFRRVEASVRVPGVAGWVRGYPRYAPSPDPVRHAPPRWPPISPSLNFARNAVRNFRTSRLFAARSTQPLGPARRRYPRTERAIDPCSIRIGDTNGRYPRHID